MRGFAAVQSAKAVRFSASESRLIYFLPPAAKNAMNAAANKASGKYRFQAGARGVVSAASVTGVGHGHG